MIAAIDWGSLATHSAWFFVGGLTGFLVAAVMVVAGDSDRWVETAMQAEPAPQPDNHRIAELEAELARVEAAKAFYFDLYCGLMTELSAKAADRN